MKLRTHTSDPSEESEQQAEERLRTTLRGRGYADPSRLPDAVRSVMLVRTNERIDRAAGGRALSLSWIVRVAVPGVVAIIAFFIGLHYYGTPVPREPGGLGPLLGDLTENALDSLMEMHAVLDTAALLDGTSGNFFDIPADMAAEYLLATDRTDLVAETLDDRQVDDLLTALAANRGTTF